MTTEGKGMDVQPMDLEEAETLARGGNVGRVSTALFLELERVRAKCEVLREEKRQLVVVAQAIGEAGRAGRLR